MQIKFKGLLKQNEIDRLLRVPKKIEWVVGNFIKDYNGLCAIYPFKNDLTKERDIILQSIIPSSQCQYLFTLPSGSEIYEYDILFNEKTDTLFYFNFNENHQISINNVSTITGKKSENSRLINNLHYYQTLSTDMYKTTEINYKEILIRPISYKIIAKYSQQRKTQSYKKYEYILHPLHLELLKQLNIPIIKSRKEEIINYKRAFAAIMSEFGYIDIYIGLLLQMDRTTILHHISQHKGFLRNNNNTVYLDIYKDLKTQAEEINKKTELTNLQVRFYIKPIKEVETK